MGFLTLVVIAVYWRRVPLPLVASEQVALHSYPKEKCFLYCYVGKKSSFTLGGQWRTNLMFVSNREVLPYNVVQWIRIPLLLVTRG